MPILNAVLGAIVLFFGRSLYWLFVGIVGFLLGMQLADATLAAQEPWVRVLIAVAAGVVGALLAIVAHRLVFATAGFFAGGYLAIAAAGLLTDGNTAVWFLVGGVVGAILAALLLDWAIIILSSLVGAGAIVAAIQLAPALDAIIYLVLVALGVFVQARSLQRTPTVAET